MHHVNHCMITGPFVMEASLQEDSDFEKTNILLYSSWSYGSNNDHSTRRNRTEKNSLGIEVGTTAQRSIQGVSLVGTFSNA